MAEITHRFIKTNGITVHIAEQGAGPTVLLLHGFPELWYSWRHQIPVLAEAGFHVVAPDLRGYGQTDAPTAIDQYTSFHVVGDLIGLLDALGEKQVFVVAHDWGAGIAWDLCLLRPDRVRAYVAVSIPFRPRLAGGSVLKQAVAVFGEGFYQNRFQEPGRAERDFASVGTKTVLKSVVCVKLETMIVPEGKELSSGFPVVKNLPSWFTEEDLQYSTENYEKSGFSGPLNYYRNVDRNWELKAPWTNSSVQTTTLFIAGKEDLVLEFPGVKEYIEGPGFKTFVPNLKDIVLLDGGHFIHEEQFAKFNEVLLAFLQQQLSDIRLPVF